MNEPTSIAPARDEGDPPIHRFDEIDSTNDEARRLAESGAPHGTTVIARRQTAGRGQFDRKWFMPPGEGVLMSVLLRRMPEGVAFDRLTVTVAERIAAALGEMCGIEVGVKHPNDLMVEGRKLGGILCEARWRGGTMLYVVVGVGINVNVESFPDDLAASACSLRQCRGRGFEVEAICERIRQALI
jgi:BirA family biotin operon repressor/biotin-[acetyl-CoA-carboxylase] ligase